MCSTRGQLDRRGASIKEGARYWVARTSMNISLEKKKVHISSCVRGLQRSPRRLQLSSLQKEIRRRVWWCVYGLDRVLSMALGRPSGANDDDCDVELRKPESLIWRHQR